MNFFIDSCKIKIKKGYVRPGVLQEKKRNDSKKKGTVLG
jgi:hypothetical protein